MKISLFSAFYPFRGGIAQFNERLTEELDKKHHVDVFTFKKQYPDFLFPGTSQFVSGENLKWKNRAKRIVSTFNPFSYFSGASKIRSTGSEIFIANYWMTIFAPFLILFAGKLKGRTKRVLLVHNLKPHESRFFDTSFNRRVLKAYDGVVVLSHQVASEVLEVKKDVKLKLLYHPWYDHFQPIISKKQARESLGIKEGSRVLLFFGLIREYKGLDVLLEAFESLDESYELVIAGEFYGSKSNYEKWLSDSSLKERIHLADRFIPNDKVHLYFSAADLCVLPYKTATQSGVTATAFHFGVPVLSTDVGGLADAIGSKGKVIPPCQSQLMASEINVIFENYELTQFSMQIENERREFSWEFFADELIEFTSQL